MDITKDNIDFLLIIGGSILVILQVGSHLIKQFFPPRVLLAEESEAYKMIEDLSDILTVRDHKGTPVIYPQHDKVNERLIDTLKHISHSQHEITKALQDVSMSSKETHLLLSHIIDKLKD